MNIKINIEEKERFLRKLGYTFHDSKESFSYNIYHNDIKYYSMNIRKVYKNGKEISYTFYDKGGETKNQQINSVFEIEFSKKLINLVTNS